MLLIERTVNDALVKNFPGFSINSMPVMEPNHRAYIRERVGADDFERINKFMCVWGNATAYKTNEAGIECLSGIQVKYYKELNLPIIDGIIY